MATSLKSDKNDFFDEDLKTSYNFLLPVIRFRPFHCFLLHFYKIKNRNKKKLKIVLRRSDLLVTDGLLDSSREFCKSDLLVNSKYEEIKEASV